MHRRPETADRFAYKLANLDMVALLHTGLGGSPKVHTHGYDHRIGHERPDWGVSGRQLALMLAMQRVYAALKGILWQTKHLPFGSVADLI